MLVFKTRAINHSTNSPIKFYIIGLVFFLVNFEKSKNLLLVNLANTVVYGIIAYFSGWRRVGHLIVKNDMNSCQRTDIKDLRKSFFFATLSNFTSFEPAKIAIFFF